MNNNWLEIYKSNYKHLLKQSASGVKRGLLTDIYDRSDGFEIIFNELFKIKSNNFQIIETGTLRKPNNWKDGNSGFLFSELVRLHDGYVQSVDIDKAAVDVANIFVDKKYFIAHHSDSVTWLLSQTNLESIDLFYLDSYDVRWLNDGPSAEHHLNEFKVIEPYLKNCIVAIDDNAFLSTGARTGKGRAIYEYLEKKNIFPIWDKYQIIYRFKND